MAHKGPTKSLQTTEMVFGPDGMVAQSPTRLPPGGPPGGRLSICGNFFITPDGQWHPNPNKAPGRCADNQLPAAEPDNTTLKAKPPLHGRTDALDNFMKVPPSPHSSNCSREGGERLLSSRGSGRMKEAPPPTHDPVSASKMQAIRMRQLGLTG